jgi:hypothetical protein
MCFIYPAQVYNSCQPRPWPDCLAMTSHEGITGPEKTQHHSLEHLSLSLGSQPRHPLPQHTKAQQPLAAISLYRSLIIFIPSTTGWEAARVLAQCPCWSSQASLVLHSAVFQPCSCSPAIQIECIILSGHASFTSMARRCR